MIFWETLRLSMVAYLLGKIQYSFPNFAPNSKIEGKIKSKLLNVNEEEKIIKNA